MTKTKKIVIVLISVLLVACMAVPCFAQSTPPTVDTDDVAEVMGAVTNQFSIANIVSFIAYIIGATIAFVFLWWAVRKGYRLIVKAVTKGRPGV